MDIGSLKSGFDHAQMPGASQSAEAKPVERTVSETIDKINRDEQREAEMVITDEMLNKSIEQANKSLETYDRRIERTVHETTHTVMYQIKDINTDEVIREFPPKKIQDMIAKMWELAGLFVDEKA